MSLTLLTLLSSQDLAVPRFNGAAVNTVFGMGFVASLFDIIFSWIRSFGCAAKYR